ncbi:MAG: cellulase family glycosylhydrolase [Spirochaetes bacterium]|nr:cellulase family glycosylhydrolase [Spirochaetota bacterium]
MRKIFLGFLVCSIAAAAVNPAADTWQALESVTASQENGIITLRSVTDAYGIYRFVYAVSADSPKTLKLSFRYRTAADKAANASFAITWMWYGADGKELKNKGSYKPLTPSVKEFRRALQLIDVPKDAARLEVRFQTQGAGGGGKFVPSYIELADLALASFGQTEESLMLLTKPLTKSTAEKRWPKNGLRGVNTVTFGPIGANTTDPGEYISEAAFKRMSDWNINLLRLWVNVDSESIWNVKKGETMPPIPDDDPMAPYKRHLDGIRVALHLAEKYNMQVIITTSDIIGRKIDVMFTGSAGTGYEQELVKVWWYIVREFGTHPNVIGYDLLNEPNTKEEMELWQKQIMPVLCKEVRTLDNNTYLIIEPGPWGLPWGFEKFTPIDDPKVVYSFHHYMPHTYTHQGIGGYKSAEYINKPYPGMLKLFPSDSAMMWDKAALEKSMAIAIDFAQKNNAIMWVGEFSAIRWAPGASRWIKDSIDIFEKYGWSWAYHCYRGWNGWNPTFDPGEPDSNDPDGGKTTESLTVLTDAWKKNMRP